MIASAQITSTEIFAFIAVLVFKLLSYKFLFINRKDNDWLYVIIMSRTSFRVNLHSKWLSVPFWTKWLWVRISMLLPRKVGYILRKQQISRVNYCKIIHSWNVKFSGFSWNPYAIIYQCFFNLHYCTFKIEWMSKRRQLSYFLFSHVYIVLLLTLWLRWDTCVPTLKWTFSTFFFNIYEWFFT